MLFIKPLILFHTISTIVVIVAPAITAQLQHQNTSMSIFNKGHITYPQRGEVYLIQTPSRRIARHIKDERKPELHGETKKCC